MLDKLQLTIGNKQCSYDDRIGTVPLLLDFEEVFTAFLTDFGALNHAQLFCHINGELMVFSLLACTSVNPIIQKRVIVSALYKSVLAHSFEPVVVASVDHKCCMKFPTAYGWLFIVKVYSYHCFHL